MTLKDILDRILFTLREPKEGAAWVIGLNWPMQARWDALFLVTIIAVILVQLTSLFEPVTLLVTVGSIELNPIVALGLSQLVLLVASVFAIDRLGRAFGGQGDLGGHRHHGRGLVQADDKQHHDGYHADDHRGRQDRHQPPEIGERAIRARVDRVQFRAVCRAVTIGGCFGHVAETTCFSHRGGPAIAPR